MAERHDDGDAELARAALSHAVRAEPPIERLVAEVPSILGRVASARRAAATPAARIYRAGTLWLPRLAGATLLLILLAALWPSRGHQRITFHGWLLTGDTQTSDPVLDALVR